MKQAFTLIEVLIFVTILSLFLITAAAIMTLSLRNTKINEHRIIATHSAEEVLEWLRGEREVDWNSFITKSSASPGLTYCFNSSPPAWPGSTGACTNYSLRGMYKRQVTLTSDSSQISIGVSISVSWVEVGTMYSTPINTTFSIWE